METPKQEYEILKVWKITKKKIRYLHAEIGKPLVVIIDELVNRELDRVTGMR